jgi:hypothetical protein
MYDKELGRFFNLDPRSEVYSSQSPYIYASDNPVIFIDSNGEGPILAIIGAIGGALVEASSQVIGGMATGSSFSEAVSGIDYADVGFAAAEYGLAGLTNGASLIVTSQVSEVLQASVDINKDGEISTIVGGLNGGKRKSLTSAGTEYVVGKTMSNLGKKAGDAFDKSVNKSVKTAKNNFVAKTKSLDKANRVIKNKSRNRSKAKNPNDAWKEFSTAKDYYLIMKEIQEVGKSKKGKGAKKLTNAGAGGTTKKVTSSEVEEVGTDINE